MFGAAVPPQPPWYPPPPPPPAPPAPMLSKSCPRWPDGCGHCGQFPPPVEAGNGLPSPIPPVPPGLPPTPTVAPLGPRGSTTGRRSAHVGVVGVGVAEEDLEAAGRASR